MAGTARNRNAPPMLGKLRMTTGNARPTTVAIAPTPCALKTPGNQSTTAGNAHLTTAAIAPTPCALKTPGSPSTTAGNVHPTTVAITCGKLTDPHCLTTRLTIKGRIPTNPTTLIGLNQ